jgi:hypothetical protein
VIADIEGRKHGLRGEPVALRVRAEHRHGAEHGAHDDEAGDEHDDEKPHRPSMRGT